MTKRVYPWFGPIGLIKFATEQVHKYKNLKQGFICEEENVLILQIGQLSGAPYNLRKF